MKPGGLPDAYLRTLRTDPRFAACAAAILLLISDDVPQPRYSTFWDPGGALLLSIIYGNCVGLAVAWSGGRIWRWWGWYVLLLGGLQLKYIAQQLLYIRDAYVVDSALVLAAHASIAAALRNGRQKTALARIAAGSVVIVAFLLLLSWEQGYTGARRLGFAPDFFTFAAARAVVPYAFWTAVHAASRLNPPAG